MSLRALNMATDLITADRASDCTAWPPVLPTVAPARELQGPRRRDGDDTPRVDATLDHGRGWPHRW